MKKTPIPASRAQFFARILLPLLVFAAWPAFGQLSETHSFTNLNRAIPDGNASGLAEFRTINSAIGSISAVRVKLKIAGQFNGDLYAYLTHGSGFAVLLNRPGKTATSTAGYDDAGFDVTFDAGAGADIHAYRTVTTPVAGLPLTGTWQPDGRAVDPDAVTDASARTALLSSFTNLNAGGEWVLFVADLESGGTNQLLGWELELTGKGTPVVTWPEPAAITYGTALGAAQLNATAGVPGTFAYTPSSGTILNAGQDQPLTVVFTPANLASYSVVTQTVNLDVNKAALQITADNKSKVYGAALPALTVAYAGFVNGDTAASLDSPVVLGTGATAASAAGTYPITVSGAADANYTITFVAGTLTVTKAPLQITAEDKAKVYGAPLPALTAAYSGFVNGDTPASLDTPAALSTTATAASAAGAYPITAGGASDANYTITFNPGTLTVSKAALQITAEDKSKVFGAPLPTLTAIYSGFVNGDTPASLDSPAVLNTTATALSNAGAYPITVSGAADANYTISFNAGTLTIAKASSSGALAASTNLATAGQSVTLTLTVSAVAPGAGTPTGSVQFRDGGVALGAPVALVNGVATLATSALTPGSHNLGADYAGDGNFQASSATLAVPVVINTAPIAGLDSVERFASQGVKVPISTLLANDTDADGDSITFNSVSPTSPAGASVTTLGMWIHYSPPAGFTNIDSFTYTISDGRGGSSIGTVSVLIRNDTNLTENVRIESIGGGAYRIRFYGLPGSDYLVQSSDTLSPPNWTPLATVTTDARGLGELTNTPPVGVTNRYYRTAR